MTKTTLLGLTGGIGSGKSTVAQMLQQQGATLIDADAVSRQLSSAGGLAVPALQNAFGPAVIAADGSLDRDAMRQLMVQDSLAKARLEAIIHPLVGAKMTAQQHRAVQAGCPLIVLDIPLLVESPLWRPQLDLILVVDCAPETQVQRVLARPSSQGWTAAQIGQVMSLQVGRAQSLAAADIVICNEGIDLHALRLLVVQIAVQFGL
jgi:dephospho-CoA kinase